MTSFNATVAVSWFVMIAVFAVSMDVASADQEVLDHRYSDIKLRLLSRHAAGAVGVDSVDIVVEALNLGDECKKAGNMELAFQCFELIAMHDGVDAAGRWLAAEKGIYSAIGKGVHDLEDRVLRLLEIQISLSPQVLKATPPGVNPDGSPMDVMVACPDSVRADVLFKIGRCDLAIPLIKRVLTNYDTCMGVLDPVKLKRIGSTKYELYEMLVACYGVALQEGQPNVGKKQVRLDLYEAMLGVFREQDPNSTLFPGSVFRFQSVVFDPTAPASEEIPKMTEMLKAAGSGETILFFNGILSEYQARSELSSAEEMEVAYMHYLRLIKEIKDDEFRNNFLASFSLRRLSNAITKLGDKDLADALIAEIEKLGFSGEDSEFFLSLQEAYLERFTDNKLLELPFGGVIQSASRGLPKKGLDASTGEGERVHRPVEEMQGRGCNFSPWYIMLPAGLMIAGLGLFLGRRK